MQSSFDILSGIYQVILPVVSGEVSGGCYLNSEPNGDGKENVIIGLLTNPINYLQKAVVNVNISVNGLNEHQANLARTKTILDLILPLLDDKEYYVGTTTMHLSIDDDKGVFKDRNNLGKFVYNIRVNCITL